MPTNFNPLSPTFTLPPSKSRAYIFTKGYFTKTLLPLGAKGTSIIRYCEVICQLPSSSSNSTKCLATYTIKWDYTSTGTFIQHLARSHPNIPKSLEEEAIKQNQAISLESLEGTLYIYLYLQ